MNTGSLNERITRALAFMLRHQPEEFDLELDRFGFGDMEDVLYALQERMGSSVSEEEVLTALKASDRARYEVKDGRIRALYGHSFPIDPGEATEPPDELFIGVGSRDAERAEDRGLRSGRRAFLHLARTEEEARETGRRIAKDYAVVTVFAGEAFDEGTDFYDRGALYLADEIASEFLEVGELQHDGIDRDEGRRSRGRRNVDGPRGPRRRGHRDDDDRGPRSRGPRPDDDRDRERPEPAAERAPEREAPAVKAEPRVEKPRAEKARAEEPRAEKPKAAAGSFGSGLVKRARNDEPVVPRPEKAPRRERAPDPEPAPTPRAEPEPEVDVPRQEADAPPSPGGFGAGLA